MSIITLSRGTYSGVKELAEHLSRELGYRLLSREELLASVAKQFGASESQLEAALKHRPGFLEGRGLKKLHYVYCARATIAKAVQGDNIVYQGEAGHVLLKGIPHHLRVRVVADEEYRIDAVMHECNLSREKAIRYVKELDKERDSWMEWVHGVDAKDPTNYDLIVNLQHINVSSASAIIAETTRRDFQTTPESQRILDDLVLASEIRARMGLDPSVADDRIHVDVKDGVVSIAANVRALVETEKVKAMALQMPGVRDVQAEIGTGS